MRYLLYFSTILLIASCAPSRFVEPLSEGKWSVGGSLGGPVIDMGAPIPAPLTSVEVGYGIDTNFTAYSALHTTAFLFGNAQLDFGVVYKFLEQDQYLPSISANVGGNFIFSPSERTARFWPIVDVNMFWNYGSRRSYFYAGINNYFDLTRTIAHEQEQRNRILFSPQIGHVFKAKGNRFQITTELKFIAPYANNEPKFVPYASILGNAGATGFYVGFRKIIGNKKSKFE